MGKFRKLRKGEKRYVYSWGTHISGAVKGRYKRTWAMRLAAGERLEGKPSRRYGFNGENLRKQNRIIRMMKEEIVKQEIEVRRAKDIPTPDRAVKELTNETEKQLDKLGSDGDYLNREKLYVDIMLKTVVELQKLWEKLPAEEKTLKNYGMGFVSPLVKALELARKATEGGHQMRYGKKIVTEKRMEKFDDFIKRSREEAKTNPRHELIDVTPEEIGGTDNKG